MHASVCGAILEIRPFGCLRSNAPKVRGKTLVKELGKMPP